MHNRSNVVTAVHASAAAVAGTAIFFCIDSEATWADKFRDSSSARHTQTANWHFVDIEITAPNLTTACFGRPALAAGTLASNGPAKDCVVDKIEQFQEELLTSATSATERREALQFVLHFVGDIHQPLHSSDEHDAGGNDKTVTAPGIASNSLPASYVTDAKTVVATQLSKAGVRLAFVLNNALK